MNFYKDEIKTLLSLELIRLFTHESVHALIRRATQNINESTPELMANAATEIGNDGNEIAHQGSSILMELELFGVKTQFRKTVRLATFDGKYLNNMLNDLNDGKMPTIEKTKLHIVDPEDYHNFALDMCKPKIDPKLDL